MSNVDEGDVSFADVPAKLVLGALLVQIRNKSTPPNFQIDKKQQVVKQ